MANFSTRREWLGFGQPKAGHPKMARIYRTRSQNARRPSRRRDSRSEATEALRGLVDAIVLMPGQGGEALQIELRGNLAAMLGTTVQTKRSSESDDLPANSVGCGGVQGRYLHLWNGAA